MNHHLRLEDAREARCDAVAETSETEPSVMNLPPLLLNLGWRPVLLVQPHAYPILTLGR